MFPWVFISTFWPDIGDETRLNGSIQTVEHHNENDRSHEHPSEAENPQSQGYGYAVAPHADGVVQTGVVDHFGYKFMAGRADMGIGQPQSISSMVEIANGQREVEKATKEIYCQKHQFKDPEGFAACSGNVQRMGDLLKTGRTQHCVENPSCAGSVRQECRGVRP